MKKFFNKVFAFVSNKKQQTTNSPATIQKVAKDHIYSVNELKIIYANQSTATATELNVLNLAMWDRARRAGYYGYSNVWPNIQIQNNIISVCGLQNGVKIDNNNGFSFYA